MFNDLPRYFYHNGGVVELAQRDNEVLYRVKSGGMALAPCMWFANCKNDAVTTESHPVLGDVPICQRCYNKLCGNNE